MSSNLDFLRQLSNLTHPIKRPAAVEIISSHLHIDSFVIFVNDPDTGELLAAPGFPQTFPQGRLWRQLLDQCVQVDNVRSELPWPGRDLLKPVLGLKCGEEGVIVLVGGEPELGQIEQARAILPAIAAALKGESLSRLKAAQANLAEVLAKQSSTLAHSLDFARQGLQKQLEERQRVEVELRKAREELQHHAANLEERVAERTAKLTETVGELEAFSYSIAHDMRSPLRAMQGYANFLIEEHGSNLGNEALHALRKISHSAIRLDRLIQDVLNYTRLVRGDITLQSINIDKLFREILDTYGAWHPPSAMVTIEENLPSVVANEAFLTQCVTNLVGNAVKFVAKGQMAKVKIFAECTGDNVIIKFQDNGIGIEEKNYERIFRMFERAHHATDYEGTGIGLAIVHKATERMGGRVGVESNLGAGSTFWIELRKGQQ